MQYIILALISLGLVLSLHAAVDANVPLFHMARVADAADLDRRRARIMVAGLQPRTAGARRFRGGCGMSEPVGELPSAPKPKGRK